MILFKKFVMNVMMLCIFQVFLEMKQRGYEDKVNQIEALYETIDILECKICNILNLLED